MITSTTRTLSTGLQALSAELAGSSEIRRKPDEVRAARSFAGTSSAPGLDPARPRRTVRQLEDQNVLHTAESGARRASFASGQAGHIIAGSGPCVSVMRTLGGGEDRRSAACGEVAADLGDQLLWLRTLHAVQAAVGDTPVLPYWASRTGPPRSTAMPGSGERAGMPASTWTLRARRGAARSGICPRARGRAGVGVAAWETAVGWRFRGALWDLRC